MKLGIIGGAGLLGATTAFCVACEGFVDEIILTDIRENVAQSHAMDIGQAVCETSATQLSVGSLDDIKFCDIVLNAAGIPEMSTASRDDYLNGNIAIYRELADKIKRWGTAPVILSATNPIDVINYSLYKMTGLPREKFVGFCRNDTLRFKWAASKETGIPASQLDALVIGEHGDGQVPVFSRLRRKGTSANIDAGTDLDIGADINADPNINVGAHLDSGVALDSGVTLDSVVALDSGVARDSGADHEAGTTLDLDDDAKSRVLNTVKTWFADYQKLDSGRSSGWTSGVGLCKIIKAILSESGEVFPCSVIPDGEYGLSGVSIGLPVRLGRSGVKEIVSVNLADDEKANLLSACEKIRRLTILCNT